MKIWVIRCSRAKSRIAVTKSEPRSRCVSAPRLRASSRFAFRRKRSSAAEFALVHVHGQQRSVEPLRVALAAAQHVRGIAARRQAHQDALLRDPVRRDAVGVEIVLQLPVHDVRRQQQRQFAQFAEPPRIGMPASPARFSKASGGASTTSISSAERRKLERHAVGRALSGDALDFVLFLRGCAERSTR